MSKAIIYHISFPKLNIDFSINPILAKIGSINVHWYGVIIATGFALAYIYMVSQRKKYNLKTEEISDFTFISSALAIIFARIYYVVFYPGDFYIKNPIEIVKISNGGIAIYGAVIGGFLGILIFCKIKKMAFLPILDITCIGLAIGQSIGRWGNFVNQEAFGTVTNLPWGMASENTNFQAVHPCFLYESVGCFICFLVLHFLSNKKTKSGTVFFTYLLIYGILRIVIESFRTDSLMIPNTAIKVSSLFSAAIIIISIAFLFIKKQKTT
ncbi:MAG: prolipoprotein diacylglyceryl transferase [Clostridia bacterium]|nr:prolipoprotein diacylglyceryl transferase [Clostridia bacterium]